MITAVIRMLLRRVCLCNLVCVYVLFRLISVARYVFKPPSICFRGPTKYEIYREDVASDPEEEKRIKKAQERAVEKKNKMVSKELRKARTLLVLLVLALVMIGCFFEVCALPFL